MTRMEKENVLCEGEMCLCQNRVGEATFDGG
jgi:hypothetical protein